MNILFLTYQGYLAGSTNSIFYLARGLADKGHTIVVGLKKDSLLEELLKPTSVITVPMNFGGRFSRTNQREIKDTVEKYGIEIINAQSSIDRYTSIFAKWRYKLPVKLYHTRRNYPKSIGGLQNYFYRKGTDKLIVISEGLKSLFQKMGFKEDHLQVIHNGIPSARLSQWSDEKVKELKKKHRLSNDRFIVGCVSRLKKQEQIVQAVQLLDDPDIDLLFVGVDEGILKSRLGHVNIKGKVIFAGKVPPDEILNYYRLFSTKVLATEGEGFGLVLLEAMAMGCPVIATDSGGTAEIIDHGETGFLFSDGDVEALASWIKKCKENREIQVMIEKARKVPYEKYTIEKTIDTYENFFLEELDHKNS